MQQNQLSGEPYLKLTVRDIKDNEDIDMWEDETYYYYYDYDFETEKSEWPDHVIFVDITLEGNSEIKGLDYYLKYNKNMLIPTQEYYTGAGSKKVNHIEDATNITNSNPKKVKDFVTQQDVGWETAGYTFEPSNSTIRFKGATAGSDRIASGTLIATLMFKLGEGITIDNLTTEAFSLVSASGLSEGLEIVYINDDTYVDGLTYLKFEGFAGPSKTITSVTVDTTNMEKTRYYTGEAIDFTGAKVTIEYDNGETEEITDIAQAVKDGKIKIDSDKASGNRKVVITAGEETCELNYNIATNISIKDNPTNMTYDHNDPITKDSFAGGSIKVIYDDGYEEPLDIVTGITEGKLTFDKTKADVNDKKVTFTYIDGTSQADIVLTVNDPVVGITITGNPQKMTYNETEGINLSGGTIGITRKSGLSVDEQAISMTADGVTATDKNGNQIDKALISLCQGDTWKNGELDAGNQPITITYEGKSATFNVVVNDTISSISVTSGPTVENKYGTPGTGLDLTGAELTVSTASGKSFPIAINVGMLDLSGYNPNTLDPQKISVSYGGKTTETDNSKMAIQLSNYIKGIEVTTPANFKVDYNTPKANLTGITYKKVYADNTKSDAITVTEDMISGYNPTPAANEFNNLHEYKETLTITVQKPADELMDPIPAIAECNVTVRDTVTGISIANRPTSVYNYGGEFSSAGGSIRLTYASGATANSTLMMTNSKVKITDNGSETINMEPAKESFTNGICTKILKVTYTDDNGKTYDADLPITINDIIESFEIETEPTKTFDHNDTFTTGNGTIKLTYASGATKQGENAVSLADAIESGEVIITEKETGSEVNMEPEATEYTNNTLTKTLVISYDGVTETKEYDITINNTIDRIEINTDEGAEQPKATYLLNETIEKSKLKGSIWIVRKAGNRDTNPIPLTSEAITVNIDTTTAGAGKATVTYTDPTENKPFTTEYDINVGDGISSVVITPSAVTEYKHGQDMDETGTITVTYAGGSSQNISITKGMIYDGENVVDLTTLTEDDYDSTTHTCTKNLTIKYTDDEGTLHTKPYTITVKNNITEVKVNGTGYKTDYAINEQLDTDEDGNVKGLELSIKRAASDKLEIIEKVPAALIPNFDTTTETEGETKRTITINYTVENETFDKPTFEITVKNKIVSAVITAPTETEHNYGEELKLTNGKITLTYSDNTTKEEDLTLDMIKENGNAVNMRPELSDTTYNATTHTWTKTLTISYEAENGIKAEDVSYTITIKNNVTKLEVMNDNYKKDYKVGDKELDLTTPLEVKVTRAVEDEQNTEILTINNANKDQYIKTFDTTVAKDPLKVEIVYEEGKTTFDVIVEDSVTDVVWKKEPGVVAHKYEDELKVEGLILSVTRTDGKTVDVPVTKEMVTEKIGGGEFDSTKLTAKGETRTLVVTYAEKQVEFQVTVQDYAKDKRIEPTETIKGKTNDELSELISKNNIQFVLVYAKDGTEVKTQLDETKMTIAGYDKTKTEEQTITVTYKDLNENSYTYNQEFEAEFKVKLNNEIISAEITAPTETEHEYGEALKLEGGKITLTYSDNTKEELPLTNATITENGNAVNMSPRDLDAPAYDEATHTWTKTLTISYETENGIKAEDVNYTITIKNNVEGLAIKGEQPAKYNVNDPLDPNLKIIVTRKVNKETAEEVAITEIPGFDTTKEGTKTVTITYEGKPVDYTYTVADTIKSIEINKGEGVEEPKTVYKYGEGLDLSKGSIKVVKGSKTEIVDLSDPKVSVTENDDENSEYNPNEIGAKTLKVTYEGKTTTYTITVKDYVSKITVSKPSITGKYNDALSKLIQDESLTYTVVYATGAKDPVALTESMVLGYSATTTETQNLKVKYTDEDPESYTKDEVFEADLSITLLKEIKEVSITVPTKESYKYGQDIDLSTGIINLTYTDDTKGTLPLTNATITENGNAVNMSPEDLSAPAYDETTHTWAKTVDIAYTDSETGKGDTQSYTFKITNDVEGIAIKGTPNTQYNVNDPLDANLEIEITRAVGTEDKKVTTDMIPEFNTTTEGTNKKATISYTENGVTQEVYYIYTVTDKVTAISINNAPKTAQYGKDIDLSNVTLTVTKGSGVEPKPVKVTKDMISGYDETQITEQEITVTYGGQTAKFKVKVQDYVTGITINPESVKGIKGDTLSKIISNVKYTVTYAKAGAQTPEALTENMITGIYDATSLTIQNLTVKYTDTDENSYTNGNEFEKTLEVKLEDVVTSITINPAPSKPEYEWGDELEDLYIDVERPNGEIEHIKVTEDMVSGFDSTPEEGPLPKKETVTITYGKDPDGNDVTTSFEVTIKDKIIGIKVKDYQEEYGYGEALDLSKGTVETIMASGTATTPVALTDGQVKVDASEFDNTKAGSYIIKVTYEGYTENFTVKVTDSVTEIKIKDMPKTEYKAGEKLDVSTGTIEVIRASGTTLVPMTPDMVTGFDPKKPGKQTLTVTYEGKTITYEVNVTDDIDHIEIKKPNKTLYNINEKMDLTGGKVIVVMASGISKTPIDMKASMISGFNTSSEGIKTITVTYEGKTATFQITVQDPLNNIVIKTLPNKVDYKYGEELDITGATIEVKKLSGVTAETIKVTKDMVTGYNPNKLGDQIITVTYEGMTTQFPVTVKDYIAKLNVKAPKKTEYEYGEDLDLTEGKVSIMMASGKVVETVNITASMISGYNKTKEGIQTVKVEYKGLQGSFQVNVVDKLKGISLNTEPNKVEYKYGENINVTGATITVVKSSGNQIVKVTKDMITGYNAKKAGKQSITITYKGFTTTFVVTVAKKAQPTKPTAPIVDTPVVEEPIIDEPIIEEPITPIVPPVVEKPEEEKPTQVLGVKDEQKDDKENNQGKILAGCIGGAGIFLLLLLLVTKCNVKVYVTENNEFVLGGKAKVSKRKARINVDKFLDEDTYPNQVKICLNDAISEKLDGKEIEIKHRGKTIKHIVRYKDEAYEIILK